MIRLPVWSLAFLLLLGSGCSRARDAGDEVDTLRVPIRYVAASDVDVKAITWVRPGMPVALEALKDTRPEPTKLGRNAEDGGSIPVLEDPPGAIAKAAEAALAEELRALGVQLVQPGPGAQRTLRVTLLRLWVEETGTYDSEARFSVEVFGPDGAPLASVLVAGTAKRFGASLSPDNYNESWSSAFGDAIENLIENAQFAAAMGDAAAPASAPAAPTPQATPASP